MLIRIAVLSIPSVFPSASPPPCGVAPRGVAIAQDEDTYEAKRAAAVEDVVDELDDLATWCKRKRLYLARDQAYESILEWDADHPEAREALGYKQRADGSWYRAKPYRAPRDRDPELLPEVAEKRSAIASGFRDRILALLEEFDDSLSSTRRDEELEKLLVLDPDDAEVRALLGQVLSEEDGAWVMPETARSLERRTFIRRFAHERMKAAPEPTTAAIDAEENEFGVEWSAGVENDRVRVLCTGAEGEAKRIAQAVYASQDVFHELLDPEARIPFGYSLYVLTRTPSERDAFVAGHPALRDADQEFLRQLSGTWLGGSTAFVSWARSEESRRDGLVRQSIGRMMAASYGVSTEQGWMWEGFGIYLTYYLLGTRLTWFVQPADYGSGGVDLSERLSGENANWLGEARRMLTRDNPPNVAFIFGRNVNQMDPSDMVLSYAVAAFLLEAHGDSVHEILTAIGRERGASEVFDEVLGLDPPAFQKRLRDWLVESASRR